MDPTIGSNFTMSKHWVTVARKQAETSQQIIDSRLKVGDDLTAPVGLYKYLINSNITYNNDCNTLGTLNNDNTYNNNNNSNI